MDNKECQENSNFNVTFNIFDNSNLIPSSIDMVHLEEKLSNLIDKIIKQKEDYLLEIGELNAVLGEKEQKIQMLSHDNSSLYIGMINIKREFDYTKKMQKIFSLKQEKFVKFEKYLTNENKKREKEIKTSKKQEEIIKRDIERLKNILNNINNPNLINELTLQFEEKKEIIENITSKITTIKNDIKIHKNCEYKKRQLLSQLSHLKSQYEYLLNSSNDSLNPYKKISNTLILKKIQHRASLISLSKACLDKSASQKSIKTPDTSFFPFFNYDRTTKRKKQNLSCENLFAKDEKKYLEIIIPKNKLDIYEKKFDNLNIEKSLIEEKLKMNKEKIKNIMNFNKEKCEFIELEMQESQKKTILLNQQLSEINKKYVQLKSKIKEIFSENENLAKIIKNKTKENEKIEKDIHNFSFSSHKNDTTIHKININPILTTKKKKQKCNNGTSTAKSIQKKTKIYKLKKNSLKIDASIKNNNLIYE